MSGQPADPNQSYFFIHVMKVGGFSLVDMVAASVFRHPQQRYPAGVDGNPISTGTQYAELLRAKERRGSQIRFYAGHFPYAAAEHLMPVKTLALFRDPVERLFSHIRHFIHYVPAYKGWTAERIYESGNTHQMFFDNLQLRMFALPSLEQGNTAFDGMTLTRADIDRAVENVRRVDVIGLTEEFEDFVRMLGVEFGWRFRQLEHVNSTHSYEFTAELRERVTRDLELDIEFYHRVREVYAERKRALLEKCGGSLPRNIFQTGVARAFANTRAPRPAVRGKT